MFILQPCMLMLGGDQPLLIGLTLGRGTEEAFRTVVDYANTLQKHLERVRNFAKDHLRIMID